MKRLRNATTQAGWEAEKKKVLCEGISWVPKKEKFHFGCCGFPFGVRCRSSSDANCISPIYLEKPHFFEQFLDALIRAITQLGVHFPHLISNLVLVVEIILIVCIQLILIISKLTFVKISRVNFIMKCSNSRKHRGFCWTGHLICDICISRCLFQSSTVCNPSLTNSVICCTIWLNLKICK